MADAEIQILISAQDKITAQLTDIQSTITKFGESNAKASEKMAAAWENGTNKLIAIGNIASSVDNIFSSLTNLEIRLENATERLANAQDRLADANKRLGREQKSLDEIQQRYNYLLDHGFEKSEAFKRTQAELADAQERVTDAQQEQERATRGLTIAENNLARAQNQVIGTYINIGIQALALAGTLPKLLASLGPIGIALGSIVVAGSALFLLLRNNAEAQEAFRMVWSELQVIWEELSPIIDSLVASLQPLIPPILSLVQSIAQFVVALWPVLKPALELIVFIFAQWADIISVVIDLISTLIRKVADLLNSFKKLPIFGGGSTLGSFQTGGMVPQTGPYLLHQGEQVISRGRMNLGHGNGGGLTINIGTIYGMNPEDVSRALKRELWAKLSL